MTTLTITIEMNNAAFEDGQYEIARILGELKERAENESLRNSPVRDFNGNKVGTVSFED